MLFLNIHFSNLVKILVCDDPSKIWVFGHWGQRSKSATVCTHCFERRPLPEHPLPLSCGSWLSLHILTSGLSSPRSTKGGPPGPLPFQSNPIFSKRPNLRPGLFKITTGSHHTQQSSPPPCQPLLYSGNGYQLVLYCIHDLFICFQMQDVIMKRSGGVGRRWDIAGRGQGCLLTELTKHPRANSMWFSLAENKASRVY